MISFIKKPHTQLYIDKPMSEELLVKFQTIAKISKRISQDQVARMMKIPRSVLEDKLLQWADAAESGDYAYVADGGDGLEVVDVSDPANPNEVGQFDDGRYACGVYVRGGYAYVADSED